MDTKHNTNLQKDVIPILISMKVNFRAKYTSSDK